MNPPGPDTDLASLQADLIAWDERLSRSGLWAAQRDETHGGAVTLEDLPTGQDRGYPLT